MLRWHKALGLVAALAAAGCTDGEPDTGSRADSSSSGGIPDLVTSAAWPDLAGGGDGMAPQCYVDNDGVISRREAPFVVGLGGLYLVNRGGTNAPVMVRAQNGLWDYSAPTASDEEDFDRIYTARGAWWSNDYPQATHARRLDTSSGLLAIYQDTVDSLFLLGIVSEHSGVSQTDLKYAKPITLLDFPLQVGASWTSESDVSGLASGVLFAAHEKYSFTVDARGITRVPAGDFDSLRLRLDQTQTYGLRTTTGIQYLHLAECTGLVARLRSKDNEPNAEFTQAAEYRRLAP